MRLREIMEEVSAGTSSAAAVAAVAQPMGSVHRRIPEQTKTTKYSNGPARDYASPRRKKNELPKNL
jgi:hypothetical protein